MKAKIQKWGNSLAIRIPKPFAEELGVEQNAEVELSLEDEELVIRPLFRGHFSLSDLLGEITDENLHGEVETGERVGSEVW